MYDEVIKKFESDLEKKINITKFHYEPLEISKENFFEAILTHNGDEVLFKEICHGVHSLIKNCKSTLLYKIIFEGKSFSIEDVDLITELLTHWKMGTKSYSRASKNIYFINCEFRTPFLIKNLIGRISFLNCVFLRDFSIEGSPTYLGFHQCKFKNKLNLEGTRIRHVANIQNCFFDENSSLSLKNVFCQPGVFFSLENTQILGTFNAENAIMRNSVLFKNISFFNEFNFDKVTFKGLCEFKNIAFSNPRSKESIKMQSIFAKALEKSGLHQVVSELGLSTTISSNNSSDDEEREYQDALQKGWLNPKQAARFLGKSVRTLQEKRKNDQMQITKESLPFKGIGRDIIYPLDALKAYLE